MGQIANCKHCGELTPIEQRNDTCNTTVCQVCQSYVITDENNAIAEVSDKWLAEFWKAKYFGIFASDKKVLVVGVGNHLGFASEHIAANLAMTTLSHPPASAFNTAEASNVDSREILGSMNLKVWESDEKKGKSKYHK